MQSRAVGLRREYVGYVVWGVMGVVVAVPEIWAAVGHGLPWQTISSTVGTGLARDNSWIDLVVIIALVLVGYYSFRYPPTRREPEPPSWVRAEGKVRKRPYRRMALGGRLTLSTKQQPDAEIPVIGWVGLLYLVGSSAIIAGAAILTDQLSSADEKYHTSYVLYGLIAVFWILGPSLVALVAGHEAPFPTLFITIKTLEERLGPLFGSLVAGLIVAGLAILLLHLVLYPFPDITHVLNPNAQ